MYQILIHIAKRYPAHNYRDIVNNFQNINIQNFHGRLPRRTRSYLSRTCKIFPWFFPLAANVIITPTLCVKPSFLSTKIEVPTNWNSFGKTFAWRQTLNTRFMLQMSTNIITKIKISTTQSTLSLPSHCFSKVFKLQ